jgi:nanoRNase/pAp phosphatase (c-di-AMP/oligoRNAs hydrolase)
MLKLSELAKGQGPEHRIIAQLKYLHSINIIINNYLPDPISLDRVKFDDYAFFYGG